MGIITQHVDKSIGENPSKILTDINIDIQSGEFVALTGRSGSGKSTLMYIISSLDKPTSGKVIIDNQDVNSLSKEDLDHFRNEKMGFVFQFHYLIAELNVLENILLPARKLKKEKERTQHALFLLNEFGLNEKVKRLPRQLSGGEQQRVAIARALVMEPAYLFADEPTGSLDSANGEIVMRILSDFNSRMKTTVVLVTHDPSFAARAQRQIRMADGRIVSNPS
jgi:putative ABC transport system ATP-binding protein/lipoprotein-releasing system ATP-binding protein